MKQVKQFVEMLEFAKIEYDIKEAFELETNPLEIAERQKYIDAGVSRPYDSPEFPAVKVPVVRIDTGSILAVFNQDGTLRDIFGSDYD